jgi:hypothetical protein
LGEVSPKAAAIIFKKETEEKMKRNAIIFECEAQHSLRQFLQEFLGLNYNNKNVTFKFEIADHVDYFLEHKQMEFKFSGIKQAKIKEKSLNNIVSTYTGEMYYSSLKDTAGTWSVAKYELVEEHDPYFFVLTNLQLVKFELKSYRVPVKAWNIYEIRFKKNGNDKIDITIGDRVQERLRTKTRDGRTNWMDAFVKAYDNMNKLSKFTARPD